MDTDSVRGRRQTRSIATSPLVVRLEAFRREFQALAPTGERRSRRV